MHYSVSACGSAGQVIFPEPQDSAVAAAALGMTQFVRQGMPVPASVAGQKHGYAQAERIEAGWSEMALEAGATERQLGREVKSSSTRSA